MKLDEFREHAAKQVQLMNDRRTMASEPCKRYPDGIHLFHWNTSLWAKDIKYEECHCGATGRVLSNDE